MTHPTRSGRAHLTVAMLVASIGIAWLSLALPADAFYSGDPGLKLLATFDVIAHPSRPFDMTVPSIGAKPAAYLDPMIAPHGDHAHILQSPVFPVISAPLVAMFGLRGASLLPALSFILMVPLLEMIRRRETPGTPATLVALTAIVASPLLFYSLEFWEHAPAVLLLTASTALLFRPHTTRSRYVAMLGGVCAGGALLLRPEAAWYLLGLFVVAPHRQRPTLLLGIAAITAPLAFASYLHSGNPFGPHISNSLAPLGDDWLAARVRRIDAWLKPQSSTHVAALLTIGIAWIVRALTRTHRHVAQLIGLCGAAAIALLASRRLVPPDSFWQAFPLAALVLVPGQPPPASRRLWILAAVPLAGVLMTAVHDGGAQWGPRFLLIAGPPLMLLAASAAAGAASAGALRALRVGLVAIIVLGAGLTSREAYRELRGAKRAYARLIAATADAVPSGQYIVTSVWWLDQITAALHHTRPVLYAPDAPRAARAISDLKAAHHTAVTLAWSSAAEGVALSSLASESCRAIGPLRHIKEGDIVLAHVVLHCR